MYIYSIYTIYICIYIYIYIYICICIYKYIYIYNLEKVMQELLPKVQCSIQM